MTLEMRKRVRQKKILRATQYKRVGNETEMKITIEKDDGSVIVVENPAQYVLAVQCSEEDSKGDIALVNGDISKLAEDVVPFFCCVMTMMFHMNYPAASVVVDEVVNNPDRFFKAAADSLMGVK